MAQKYVPGAGYLTETGSAQHYVPGGGYVTESAGGGGDTITANLGTATAAGFIAAIAVSVTIACSLGGATASGHQATISTGSNVTISYAIGTATASDLSDTITSSGSTTITTDAFKNNTGTVLASTVISSSFSIMLCKLYFS